MSAVVLTFNRARRTAADLSEKGLLIRVRVAARIAGCDQDERKAVEAEAIALRASGESMHEVTERCASLASAIVRQRLALDPEIA